MSLHKRKKSSRVASPPLPTIGQEWISFRKAVYPADAAEAQLRELRMAFIAGAAAMRSLLHRLGDDTYSEADGVAALQKIDRELLAFNSLVKDSHV